MRHPGMRSRAGIVFKMKCAPLSSRGEREREPGTHNHDDLGLSESRLASFLDVYGYGFRAHLRCPGMTKGRVSPCARPRIGAALRPGRHCHNNIQFPFCS